MWNSFTIKEVGKKSMSTWLEAYDWETTYEALFHTRNTKHIRQHKIFRIGGEMSGTCVSGGNARSITNHNVIWATVRGV